MKHPLAPPFLLAIATIASSAAPDLLEKLKDDHARGAENWIYNDFEKAKAEAKRLNRPIFVTFRCVPCEACSGFDAEVAQGSDRITNLRKKSFVSLRQVEMKNVDLSQFQFDYDLNWAAMFINSDGTVYGRYGTQSAQGADAYNSIPSLEQAMLRVLSLHRNYPRNKAELAPKKGAARPYRTALQMPGLTDKEKYAGTTARNNCIHCHNIHDAEYEHLLSNGKLTPQYLWRYPLPDNVGIIIDHRDGQLVKQVLPGSPAAVSGLRPGHRIVRVNGQPIISIADIQWVLHNLPDRRARISILANSPKGLTNHEFVTTSPSWKRTDPSWRGSMWNVRPRMRVWMPDATAQETKRLKLPPGQKALKVKWINHKTSEGNAVLKAGLREGDFIVAIEGKPVRFDHRQFNTYVKLNYKTGQTIPLTLSRNGKNIRFNWPLK